MAGKPVWLDSGSAKLLAEHQKLCVHSIMSAGVGASSVEFGAGPSASVDVVVSAVEQGLEVMRRIRECIDGLQAAGRGTDVRTMIALLLVELGGFDCAVLWRVDDSLLTPFSAAFTPETVPSTRELDWLVSNPPRLEQVGLEPKALGDVDRGAAGSLGSGGPLEPLLGPLSYAVAAVKRGANPTFVLQAIYRGRRRMSDVDRDLVLAFAELTATLITEPGVSELLNRCRGWAGAAPRELTTDHPPRLQAVPADGRIEDAPTPVPLPAEPAETSTAAALNGLTRREHEVLTHALTGATYVEIADRLFVTTATVHTHMRSILRKLSVHSRVQLMARYGMARSHDQAAG